VDDAAEWERERSGSGSGSRGKYRRLAGRAEGTGHQPSAISRQPGVPRRLQPLEVLTGLAPTVQEVAAGGQRPRRVTAGDDSGGS